MEVELCFESEHPSSSLVELHQKYVEGLASTATLLRNEDIARSKRCTISSLLALNTHGRDIISGLSGHGVTSSKDFEWIR